MPGLFVVILVLLTAVAIVSYTAGKEAGIKQGYVAGTQQISTQIRSVIGEEKKRR
jgi:hypothetical protein